MVSSNDSKQMKDTIQEAVSDIEVCDRILRNDSKISKRYDIRRLIQENIKRDFTDTIINCCSMFDTWDVPNYAKMQITLEEVSYILQESGIKYNESDMVRDITRYFLNHDESVSLGDMMRYKATLESNQMINESSLNSIEYFLKEDFNKMLPSETEEDVENNLIKLDTRSGSDKVSALLYKFEISLTKDKNTYNHFISKVCELPASDVIDGCPIILEWFRNYGLNELYSVKIIKEGWKNILTYIISSRISKAEAERFLEILNNENIIILSKLDKTADDPATHNIISDYHEMIYTSSTCVNNYLNDGISVQEEFGIKANQNLISLQEFKDIRLPIIGKDFDQAKSKEKSFMSNTVIPNYGEDVQQFFFTFKNWNKPNSELSQENIDDCITADNHRFDTAIAAYQVENVSRIDSFRKDLKALCDSYNLEHNDSKLYFESVEYIFELNFTTNDYIQLTEAEEKKVNNCFTDLEKGYCGLIMQNASAIDILNHIDYQNLQEEFDELIPYLNADSILGIMEYASIAGGAIKYSKVQSLVENYIRNHPDDYINNSRLQDALESFQIEENVEFIVTAEATMMLTEAIANQLNEVSFKPGDQNKQQKEKSSNLIQQAKDNISNASKNFSDRMKEKAEKDQKDKEQKAKDKQEKDKEKGKLNLNNLKLAILGLRDKARKINDKGQEVSHTIDLYADRFMKAVKKLYVTDEREAIIKGSIIPSFRKLMAQIIVGTTGYGILSIFNPALAIVSAALYVFSLIVLSKKSTEKERALLLDELDIEIDVCEKQIRLAEEKNQIKKYRALQIYKKKLQREKQRLIYKIKYKSYVDVPVESDRD